jgi:hypothetical protein
VASKHEANAICAALDALRAKPELAGEYLGIGSPVFTLTALFQQVESNEAFDVLKQEGLPRLRSVVRDGLQGKQVNDMDVMLILKILAMYRQREDIELIAEAARKPIDDDNFMWSIIFGQFDAEHPFSQQIVDTLRDPLPTGFILIAYLDMANRLAIAGDLKSHPFDTETGRKHLETWLRDTNEETFSYARSATAALPFIAQPSRDTLLQITEEHPDVAVRLEAAWARAKSGDPAGLSRLSELCLDPSYSHTAQQYLEELDQSDKIPDKAKQPDFRALAEMANWLAHPNEFGRPPDKIELYDTRDLYWPPTKDKRRVWLAKYTFSDEKGGEPERGVGMVGSVTFALFGEATIDLSPEDIYGLYCCWEMQWKKDTRAPKERSAEAGRTILGRHNPGF